MPDRQVVVILMRSFQLAGDCAIFCKNWQAISLYWCPLAWPCQGFMHSSANQTKTSWPSFCGSSSTSPQRNLRLWSLTRKPKRRDNHHTVLWSATGLESPNSPVSNRASSSSSSMAWAACSLFPLLCSWTSDFGFAARTFLDFSNSLSLSMLNGYFVSLTYRCILRWKLETVAGSYSSPFFLRALKKNSPKGGQARTQESFQFSHFSHH